MVSDELLKVAWDAYVESSMDEEVSTLDCIRAALESYERAKWRPLTEDVPRNHQLLLSRGPDGYEVLCARPFAKLTKWQPDDSDCYREYCELPEPPHD